MTGRPKSPRGASKYDEATRERAVRLVVENADRFANETQCVRHVAGQVGMHVETLRRWVREARAEAGEVVPYMDWKDRRVALDARRIADRANRANNWEPSQIGSAHV